MGVTETFEIAELVQPNVDPMTVNVEFDDGETDRVFVLAPVSHIYVDAPFAINVVDVPLQIEVEFTEIVGFGVTNTTTVSVLLQLFVVPITEYVVFEVGETVNGFADEAVLHSAL
jgi:hypothetical protein